MGMYFKRIRGFLFVLFLIYLFCRLKELFQTVNSHLHLEQCSDPLILPDNYQKTSMWKKVIQMSSIFSLLRITASACIKNQEQNEFN